jgi:hypothetical protein
MIDSFILGDNAFFGVNHRSRSEGDERAKQFHDPREVARICAAARRNGAGGVMLSSHERSASILKAIAAAPELKGFRIYPNIPYLMKYVQRSTQAGVGGLMMQVLSGGAWHRQLAALTRGAAAYLKKDFRAMLSVAVELELAPYRDHPLPAIFLHNGLADLALGLGWTDILAYWDELIRVRHQAIPGFGTLNLPLMRASLTRAGVSNPLIMAPFNVSGFHMNPSQASCEATAREDGFTLLAMNVLVSGAASPEDAFAYLGRFPHVRHAVIGASSDKHLTQNAALLKKYLGV